VWFPARSKIKEPVKYLQSIQNSALRSITGNHAAASVQHLHEECKILPVEEHLQMQCTKFLVNMMRSLHPSHSITNRPPGARLDMKPTLQQCFGQEAAIYAHDRVILESNCKKAIKSIHTNAVTSYPNKRAPNRVLSITPPEVHPDEALLPPAYRTTMTRLRSDFCRDLQSYRKFIRAAADDICPGCLSFPHTTAHIFSCPSTPTALKPINL
jgi:hypothetical protein